MPSELSSEQLAHIDESKQGAIIGALILILCLANFSVVVRVIAQFRTSRRLFAEDYSIAIALVNTYMWWNY